MIFLPVLLLLQFTSSTPNDAAQPALHLLNDTLPFVPVPTLRTVVKASPTTGAENGLTTPPPALPHDFFKRFIPNTDVLSNIGYAYDSKAGGYASWACSTGWFLTGVYDVWGGFAQCCDGKCGSGNAPTSCIDNNIYAGYTSYACSPQICATQTVFPTYGASTGFLLLGCQDADYPTGASIYYNSPTITITGITNTAIVTTYVHGDHPTTDIRDTVEGTSQASTQRSAPTGAALIEEKKEKKTEIGAIVGGVVGGVVFLALVGLGVFICWRYVERDETGSFVFVQRKEGIDGDEDREQKNGKEPGFSFFFQRKEVIDGDEAHEKKRGFKSIFRQRKGGIDGDEDHELVALTALPKKEPDLDTVSVLGTKDADPDAASIHGSVSEHAEASSVHDTTKEDPETSSSSARTDTGASSIRTTTKSKDFTTG